MCSPRRALRYKGENRFISTCRCVFSFTTGKACLDGKISFATLSASDSGLHRKQVFFHSKHVVALGGSHPAASSQCSGVGAREVGRRDSVWGWGVADPESLQMARPVLRNI